MEELQRISQMSVEEARGILLTEVEKDARNDMAKIIRQIETEALGKLAESLDGPAAMALAGLGAAD